MSLVDDSRDKESEIVIIAESDVHMPSDHSSTCEEGHDKTNYTKPPSSRETSDNSHSEMEPSSQSSTCDDNCNETSSSRETDDGSQSEVELDECKDEKHHHFKIPTPVKYYILMNGFKPI